MTTTVIQNFDYCVIQCGYTERLVKHLADIREKCLEILECDCPTDESQCQQCVDKKVIYIGDTMYGNPNDFACVTRLLTMDQMFDSICFPAKNLSTAFALVEMLTKYGHCACFSKIPHKMELVQWGSEAPHRTLLHPQVQGSYKGKDIKILVMSFDTESG